MKPGYGEFEGSFVRGPSRRPPSLALAFFVFVLGTISLVSAQDLESVRASLKAQIKASDFSERLTIAVDRANDVEDAIALLSEFTSAVRDGGRRRALLLRWAALLELSGNWQEAAERYDEAAFAEPGRRDTTSLVAEARALLAAGETEKALSILKVLEIASADSSVRETAGILKGWAHLIEGSLEEARSMAERIAKESSSAETRLNALTLLWASSEGANRDTAAGRIRADFPGTPEAVMTETGNIPAYGHWLLTQASGCVRPKKTGETGPGASGVGESNQTVSVPENGSSEGAKTSETTSSVRVIAYQVGAFVHRQNADAVSKELSNKSIPCEVSEKERGGETVWSVLVPAGEDPQATLLRLKDAGYEAYPIF